MTSSYFWLLVPLVLCFLWLQKFLRRQQRRLGQQPSSWQAFVAETRRMRREQLRSEDQTPTDADGDSSGAN